MATARRLKSFAAFLRGINVGAAGRGRKSVPMARLRALVEGLGHRDVQTYIQSGNVVFQAAGTAAALGGTLERAIAAEFGFDVPVVVRPIADLVKVAHACPFGDEAVARPNLVHVGFARGKLPKGFADEVAPYCTADERVQVVGQAIWVDFPNGVGRSKLTPAVFDRAAGSPVTMRNTKTLHAVLELARA